MAVIYLTEGSTTLAAAGWSDATGLVADSTAVIDRGAQSIQTNLDFSGMATHGINYLEIRAGFSGTIGAATAPLKLCASHNTDPHIYYAASAGSLYQSFLCTVDSDTNTKFEMPYGAGGKAYLIGGTCTTLNVLSSECQVATGCVVTNAVISGGSVTFDYNATAITSLIVLGGTVVIKRNVTTLTHIGGTVIYDSENASPAITTVNSYGGFLDHRNGNIATWNWYAGAYTNQSLRRDSSIGTTAAAIYPAASGALMRAKGATVTWTTANITYVGSNSGPSSMAYPLPNFSL